jgi:hypothetical protein
MVKFPSTPSPNNVLELFEKIQTIGVPKTKVNFGYLKSLGFKSSYDSYLPQVLKSLGFTSSDGSPTSTWQDYGVKKESRSVMASAIKNAYSELFHMYPNAYQQPDSALVDFFKGKTGASDKDVGLMVKTFQNLCTLADFKVAVVEPTVATPSPEMVAPEVKVAPRLQLNIEIHIAPDTPDDKIKVIFENMKKYLMPNE